MKTHIHSNDISADVVSNMSDYKYIAIDTEAMGLNYSRDRLCTIQLCIDNKSVHIITFSPGKYNAPNLAKLLKNKKILKIFHFARFDMTMIYKYLGIVVENIVCTRILSKVSRTYTQRHGLKDLCYDFCNKVELNKKEQTSDWGNPNLTNSQISYAGKDVVYLYEIYTKLRQMAEREKRYNVAKAAFDCLRHVMEMEVNFYDPMELLNH